MKTIITSFFIATLFGVSFAAAQRQSAKVRFQEFDKDGYMDFVLVQKSTHRPYPSLLSDSSKNSYCSFLPV
jgi:hypothetical protein